MVPGDTGIEMTKKIDQSSERMASEILSRRLKELLVFIKGIEDWCPPIRDAEGEKQVCKTEKLEAGSNKEILIWLLNKWAQQDEVFYRMCYMRSFGVSGPIWDEMGARVELEKLAADTDVQIGHLLNKLGRDQRDSQNVNGV